MIEVLLVSAILAKNPPWVGDAAEILALILAFLGVAGVFVRSWRSWMVKNVSGPIQKVCEMIEHLSERVHTLEIVHNTEGVSASEITDMLGARMPGGKRLHDPEDDQ